MLNTHAHRRPLCLAACGVLLVLASCTLTAYPIDQTAGGPNVPADTAIRMSPAMVVPSSEMPAPSLAPGPLKVTVTEAILMSLENNRALVVQRLNPDITQTFEDQERAVFDPAIAADLSTGRLKGERQARAGSQTETFSSNTTEGVIVLDQYFPTGTAIALEASSRKSDSSLYDDPFYSTRLGLTATQALLRGFGTDVNLVRLYQARLDTRLSEYELRGFTEELVAEVERTCWDYALARRQIEIVEESLKVARQQRDETQALIAVGRLAKAELPAVQAEVAAQEQALIEARAEKETIRLQLLRLLNPAGPDIWQREVELIHQSTLPDITLEDVTQYVAASSRMRPLLNQARLELLRGDLELAKTRNGLLPLMDLFITLGKSGYADAFGRSIDRMDEDSYDALVGVRFQYPFFNRDAKALHRRAQLSREQTQDALDNLLHIVEVDVRTAYIEVERTKQQIAATSVTRKFNEEKLRTETEKLRVGKSISFLVAQAQRDLLVSRIAEVQALANYLKALIDLYRQDGSLLVRRGISAPGREPVTLPTP
ncbi:MAG: TolC family protein [Desulfobacterales bacterium]|jgi:outer membrane protein TolC